MAAPWALSKSLSGCPYLMPVINRRNPSDDGAEGPGGEGHGYGHAVSGLWSSGIEPAVGAVWPRDKGWFLLWAPWVEGRKMSPR